MSIPQKVIKFLDENKIKYEIVNHRTVYTAFDKAATLKVKPNMIGKTLVLKTNTDLVIVLIPGNKNLHKNKFKKAVNEWIRLRQGSRLRPSGFGGQVGGQGKKQELKLVKKIDFVSEAVMKNKFKGIKIGAVPPLGELYKLPTFVDRGLLKEKNIFINSGIYEASFKISPKIFEKIGAISGNFSKAQ